MDNKKYVGTFHSIDSVLYKITELKARGYDEGNMYSVTIEEDNISMLRGYSNIELLSSADENWLNRFKLFLKGEEPIWILFHVWDFQNNNQEIITIR